MSTVRYLPRPDVVRRRDFSAPTQVIFDRQRVVLEAIEGDEFPAVASIGTFDSSLITFDSNLHTFDEAA